MVFVNETQTSQGYAWQRVQITRVPAGKNPLGRGSGFGFVPTGTDAGLHLNPTGKILRV